MSIEVIQYRFIKLKLIVVDIIAAAERISIVRKLITIDTGAATESAVAVCTAYIRIICSRLIVAMAMSHSNSLLSLP